MKKLNLLVLTPLVIATAGTSVAFANNSSTSLELSTAVTANTNLFFKNTYEIKSTLELFYEVPITFEIFDQVSPSNRVSKSYLYGDLYEELSFVRSAAGLGPVAALVAFVVGCFAVLVPTPNGAGPWHFVVKTALVLYGVQDNDAAVFALIVHTLQTLLTVVLGLYALAALAMTRMVKTVSG